MSLKDVVIIGAGAAGSAAAFHLANNGWKVTLLEKDSSDSIKPCGGGIAAAVQDWFPFELSPAVVQIINRVEFSWCLSDNVIAQLPGSAPFWIVERKKLDQLITNKAIDAGAELLRPFQVVDLKKQAGYWQLTSKDGRELESKAVVIADGSNSVWPKVFKLGPRIQHHASTTSVKLAGKGNLLDGSARFEFGLVHHGFAWAFPVANGVNVGVGTFIGDQATNSEAILEKFLPSLGFDPHEGSRQNAQLRVWNGHHNLHGDGILAVGDAASLCDPFLAEGLRPALMSGCEAAQSIHLWLQDKTFGLGNYTNSMRTRWGNSMAWGRRIAQVFYRFPKVGYQLGIKRPTAPQRIAQILSGEMGYGDIAQRVIKRLLLKK
ncbi:geranylgeranyl reductase family protein [Prochlorococcus sp. MIT 1300]|uniref:NAD(P)/FAD-dependent oxidoreductase n=1 Tax=Prochlorococcus sp. MIT 1300 TaxID=3096218 RepID=UPI002A75A36A|nr:geranylgeranyl reductase family protein [Prochlorococcus sp. MIT 1300]